MPRCDKTHIDYKTNYNANLKAPGFCINNIVYKHSVRGRVHKYPFKNTEYCPAPRRRCNDKKKKKEDSCNMYLHETKLNKPQNLQETNQIQLCDTEGIIVHLWLYTFF